VFSVEVTTGGEQVGGHQPKDTVRVPEQLTLYCNRYRNAARSQNTPDSSMGNAGFRTVSRAIAPASHPVESAR
jgi:hypothetical protein